MADPPPPAAGEGLLPPPFLPAAPPPAAGEGLLPPPFLPAAPPPIHGPRSNMGTCKESPRSKKRKKLFDEYNLEVSAHSQREMDSPNTKEVEVEDDPLVEWDQHMRSKRRQAINELDCYLKEELLPRKKEVDIIQWWKVSSSKYPVLSKMTRDILVIPASTVLSESAFSTEGHVVSDYRSSLSSSTVEILICL